MKDWQAPLSSQEAEIGSAQTAFIGSMPPAAPSSAVDEARQEELDDTLLGAARAQLHKTYIVAETRDGITIIDQHAAHERLVMERMKAACASMATGSVEGFRPGPRMPLPPRLRVWGSKAKKTN